eukprot:14645816-Alexandrium_andersonii.AAC.1
MSSPTRREQSDGSPRGMSDERSDGDSARVHADEPDAGPCSGAGTDDASRHSSSEPEEDVRFGRIGLGRADTRD